MCSHEVCVILLEKLASTLDRSKKEITATQGRSVNGSI